MDALRRGEEIHRGLIAEFIGDANGNQRELVCLSLASVAARATSGARASTMRERDRYEFPPSTQAPLVPLSPRPPSRRFPLNSHPLSRSLLAPDPFSDCPRSPARAARASRSDDAEFPARGSRA